MESRILTFRSMSIALLWGVCVSVCACVCVHVYVSDIFIHAYNFHCSWSTPKNFIHQLFSPDRRNPAWKTNPFLSICSAFLIFSKNTSARRGGFFPHKLFQMIRDFGTSGVLLNWSRLPRDFPSTIDYLHINPLLKWYFA